MSRPSDPIEQFLNKLPAHIIQEIIGNDSNASTRRRTLVTKGGEALRILKAKRAVLTTKERPLTRAGLVVDFLCHQGYCCNQTSIPLQTLSELLNIKRKKDVEQNQALVNSYLEASFRIKPDKRGQKRKNASIQDSKVVTSTNLIKELCIRLGPMISNAEFAASYAQQLFIVLTNSSNNKGHSREFYLLMDDISRNVEYYEAVCLYLAVQKMEGPDYMKTKRHTKKAPNKKGNESLSVEENSDAEENEDEMDMHEDRTLSERDIINAANLREGMFRDTLECVKDYMKDTDIPIVIGNIAAPDAVSTQSGGAPDASKQSKKHVNSEKYEHWKGDILKKACVGQDIATAADEVLQRFGIVDKPVELL